MEQYSPKPSVHARGLIPRANSSFPDGSTVVLRRSAWKARPAILYFRARDSVLSVRTRPSNGARCRTDTGKREQHMTASVAFVTKSYTPDLERCELLCRSIELLAPGASHWIIVDSRDLAAFRGLENATTRIVTTEELLPRRIRRLELYGTGKNIWLGARTPPIRGWLVQQLAKFAITLVAPRGRPDSRRFRYRPHPSVSGGDAHATKAVRFGCSESRQQSAKSFRVTCAGIGRPSGFSASRLGRAAARLHQRPGSLASGARRLTARRDRGSVGP